MIIMVRDGNKPSYEVDLDSFGKEVVGFGRQNDCDLVLHSPFVSRVHGCFYKENNTWHIQDMNSTYGLFYNDRKINTKQFLHGETITIYDSSHNQKNCVSFTNITNGNVSHSTQPQNGYVPQPIPVYSQNGYAANPMPVYPQNGYAPQPNLGMMWFNFLIYFGLFAVGAIYMFYAIINFRNFYEINQGLEQYGEVYSYIDEDWREVADEFVHVSRGLTYEEACDVCIFYFVLAAVLFLIGLLPFIIRQKLAAFEIGGIDGYLLCLGISIGLNILLLLFLIVKYDGFSLGSTLTLIFQLGFFAANKVYFDKRKHLFH